MRNLFIKSLVLAISVLSTSTVMADLKEEIENKEEISPGLSQADASSEFNLEAALKNLPLEAQQKVFKAMQGMQLIEKSMKNIGNAGANIQQNVAAVESKSDEFEKNNREIKRLAFGSMVLSSIVTLGSLYLVNKNTNKSFSTIFLSIGALGVAPVLMNCFIYGKASLAMSLSETVKIITRQTNDYLKTMVAELIALGQMAATPYNKIAMKYLGDHAKD